jgi:hypothetical protein
MGVFASALAATWKTTVPFLRHVMIKQIAVATAIPPTKTKRMVVFVIAQTAIRDLIVRFLRCASPMRIAVVMARPPT